MRSIEYIDDAVVAQLLTWPLVIHAVDQALRSVCQSNEKIENGSIAQQPARSFTRVPGGVLLTMPGYIGNYSPTTTDLADSSQPKLTSTLACKLVTSFPANDHLEPPTPSILATIMLFDTTTGSPRAIIGATEITTWRTVAASLVATKHLWFGRHKTVTTEPQLAVLGTGVQGRMHAIGMLSTFKFSSVRLWNRTRSKALAVATELEATFGVKVIVAENVEECVDGADVLVTATYAAEPLLKAGMLKAGVHINAIGAGLNHHSELADDVYARSAIYVDSIVSARSELATLNHPILGQVGEVILGQLPVPSAEASTVFQSMGMAVEDAAVAQAVLDLYHRK